MRGTNYHHWYADNWTTCHLWWFLGPMWRHRMGWSYLLCAWVYLPRAQPLLLTVHSWRLSDTGTVNNDTSAVNDDRDNISRDNNADEHADARVERVQAFLRAKLRQLVVQMFMVLLQRLLAVHNQHDCLCNCYNNCQCNLGDDHHIILHSGHSIAFGMQALVCEICTALEYKVQVGKVFGLC